MATKKSSRKSHTAKKKPPKKGRLITKRAAKRAPKRKAAKKRVRHKQGFAGKSEVVGQVVYQTAGLGARSGGQSGDLQGLSNRRRAGSESVDELLEEGNAFEAEVVQGVEDVEDEEEVRTHEVPEDDVPDEYRDKD